MLERRVRKLVEEHVVDGHVERRDHFLRVVDELPVEVAVELLQVLAVDVEERLADHVDLRTTKDSG